MEIHCISDIHGYIPSLPGGDILIVAGDLTYSGSKGETKMLFSWLDSLPYKDIVVIAGNHDKYLSHGSIPSSKAHYLMNSGVEINGIRIWGSPYSVKFRNWCFGMTRGFYMKKLWDTIPEDTDILVTHGPPMDILDENSEGTHCGCDELSEAIFRIRPKLSVFGHIHEQYGREDINGITFVNCSYVDEDYKPRFKFQRVEYED